ncbi:hypothetical protein C0J52_05212 [Blattella germanica]|nr:hypothetical protein C0J52_05212 [Blattella germanica]
MFEHRSHGHLIKETTRFADEIKRKAESCKQNVEQAQRDMRILFYGFFLLLYLEVGQASRKRRFLIFPPEGSINEVIIGFGLPALVQEQSLTIGTVIKFVYDLPVNATPYTDAIFNRQKRSRWDIYTSMEAFFGSIGVDGRACILRTICEAAEATLKHNGIVGELLHVLLTPSSTSEPLSAYGDSEYHAAERLGSKVSDSCHLLYSECTFGILDFVSEIEFS